MTLPTEVKLLLASQGGYQISRSVRLRSSASAYFNRTMAVGGVTVYTFSAWVKRGELGTIKPIVQGYLNNNNYGHIIFKADNTIEWREFSVAVNYGQVNTNAVFRDPSAWYHIVVVRNGTSLLIYVNGVSQTLTVSTGVNAAAGYLFGGSTDQRIGRDQVNSAFFDGYLTECYLIDGQALTPSSFGETNAVTGVWQPKKYAGTYGTNGFYLNFSDNSAATAAAIGKDYSGNGNNWTPNNISVTAGVTYDSMLDVPTQWGDGGNGRGNYATLNPLSKGSASTYANGNLQVVTGLATSPNFATIQIPDSGKWYWEYVGTATGDRCFCGISNSTTTIVVAYYGIDGNKYINGTGSAYGSTYTTNDVIGVAVDVDSGSITYYKNNVSQGAITQTIIGNQLFPYIADGAGGFSSTIEVNFGQRPFSYTPPTGFKALNTLNLPTPTILKGNQYFDATLWDGNSTNARVITTNVGTVDFAWVKKRNGIDDHRLANTVTGGNRHLQSNTTAAESTGTTVIQAFSGSTFTVGTDNSVNVTGGTYVGWTWSEGATQGFDIVTYTGDGTSPRNISHSLGVIPAMVIVKSRSAVASWIVKHQNLSSNNNVFLESTAAQSSPSNGYIQNLTSSSTFGVVNGGGGVANINANGTTYIAYLFAAVSGYSAFGSYTGNGSADGPFVFCGFRPRFVMWKNASAVEAWLIEDTARSTYNEVALELYPSSSGAEAAGSSRSPTQQFDYLSNGFKVRGAQGQTNGNGNTIIYAAFAEHPFKNALAR